MAGYCSVRLVMGVVKPRQSLLWVTSMVCVTCAPGQGIRSRWTGRGRGDRPGRSNRGASSAATCSGWALPT